MKRLILLLVIVVLAACGSSDNASTEADCEVLWVLAPAT